MYTKEEKKRLVKKFWELFATRCNVHPQLKDKRKKWILHRTKIKNVALKFFIDREKASVMIELSNRDENKRLLAFEILERYKNIIENGFDTALNWEYFVDRPDSGQHVCQISKNLYEVDIHRKNQWPDIYNFFIENMLLLESNFMDVRDILQDELR